MPCKGSIEGKHKAGANRGFDLMTTHFARIIGVGDSARYCQLIL
jgi:hypothetical protein